MLRHFGRHGQGNAGSSCSAALAPSAGAMDPSRFINDAAPFEGEFLAPMVRKKLSLLLGSRDDLLNMLFLPCFDQFFKRVH